MDKRSYLGLFLIFVVIVVFYWINQPSEEERARWQQYHEQLLLEEQQRQDSIARAQLAQQQLADTISPTDTAAIAAAKKAKFGLLTDVSEGTEQFTTIENNVVKVVFSNKGARIYSVVLKDYKSFGDKPLCMFNGQSNEFGFGFTHNNRTFYTNELYFGQPQIQTAPDSTQSVTFSIPIGDGSLVYKYSLPNNSYAVDFSLSSVNLGDKISVNGAAIDLEWIMDMPALEKGHKAEGMWSSIYYRYTDGDVEELGTMGEQREEVNMGLQWIAFKDQYFSSILVAKESFAGAQLSSRSYNETDSLIKHVDAKVGVKHNFSDNSTSNFQFIFVPNYFYTLDSFEGLELTELLPLGWGIFGLINEYFIIPVFKYLENVFSNYGIIILILTLIIKLIIFPMTYSSYKSQAKMRVLKPQIDAINEKIPADKPLERQQATMALYKKAGVSPMGGCLPMLIQMPILFAAFRFFPAAVELRGQSFLWADDLSTFDSVLNLPFSIPFYGDHISLFCLLMCITNIVFTKFNMQTQSSSGMPGMKFMMYFMPIMLLFFFNDYPSGLCYYYFLSTLITVIQTIVINRFFIDEQAILEKIEANKKRPSNGKSRFERMMEAQMKKMPKK